MVTTKDKSQSQIAKENNDKGIELEKRFSEFMKSDLGYRKVGVRMHVRSNVKNTNPEIDVIGEKLSQRGKTLRVLFYVVIVMCIVYVISGLYNNSVAIVIIGLAFALIALYALRASRRLHFEHAWVECKNQGKDKVNIDQVRKSVNDLQDYHATKNKEYLFCRQFYVSTSGFVDDALKYANANGITCFIEKSGNFEIATKWNI